jgi:hypothetical protein
MVEPIPIVRRKFAPSSTALVVARRAISATSCTPFFHLIRFQLYLPRRSANTISRPKAVSRGTNANINTSKNETRSVTTSLPDAPVTKATIVLTSIPLTRFNVAIAHVPDLALDPRNAHLDVIEAVLLADLDLI